MKSSEIDMLLPDSASESNELYIELPDNEGLVTVATSMMDAYLLICGMKEEARPSEVVAAYAEAVASADAGFVSPYVLDGHAGVVLLMESVHSERFAGGRSATILIPYSSGVLEIRLTLMGDNEVMIGDSIQESISSESMKRLLLGIKFI